MKRILIIAVLLCLIWGKAIANPRYISLAPSTTEILFALGLDEEIVGVSSYCDYPLEAKNKTKVGDFSQPNMEKISFLKPDYVFCTALEQAPVVAELKRMNLNVYVSDPTNIEELFNSILNIGNITHREKEAQELTRSMQTQIKEIAEKVRLIPPEKRPKVFLEIWHDPLTTAGPGSFIDDLVTLAGGINIARDTKRPYAQFSQEAVIMRNPDCIILAYMGKEKGKNLLRDRFCWSQIKAVKNNRVYNDIDPNLLFRPGPRAVLGLKEIYKRLYNE